MNTYESYIIYLPLTGKTVKRVSVYLYIYAFSRNTAYTPQRNGQVERYNRRIWKTVLLALNSKGVKKEHWENMIQPPQHSVRSLLCTAINATLYEPMYTHPRRSFNGRSLPTCLTQPGPSLMKNHLSNTKYDLIKIIDIYLFV